MYSLIQIIICTFNWYLTGNISFHSAYFRVVKAEHKQILVEPAQMCSNTEKENLLQITWRWIMNKVQIRTINMVNTWKKDTLKMFTQVM